jgi:hypothetical protein
MNKTQGVNWCLHQFIADRFNRVAEKDSAQSFFTAIARFSAAQDESEARRRRAASCISTGTSTSTAPASTRITSWKTPVLQPQAQEHQRPNSTRQQYHAVFAEVIET